LYVTNTLWPDFKRAELLEAILDYQRRNRRFGGLGQASRELARTTEPGSEEPSTFPDSLVGRAGPGRALSDQSAIEPEGETAGIPAR
jgi:hypothetical protein